LRKIDYFWNLSEAKIQFPGFGLSPLCAQLHENAAAPSLRIEAITLALGR
jgi:hypothetical protein